MEGKAMKDKKEINIGKSFSKVPSGRFWTDGDYSGEAFREETLLPIIRSLSENETVDIILDDGVEGYGSSFLTEAFAGIVKYGYMDSNELLRKINLIANKVDFIFFRDKAITYIKQAKFNSKDYKSTKHKAKA